MFTLSYKKNTALTLSRRVLFFPGVRVNRHLTLEQGGQSRPQTDATNYIWLELEKAAHHKKLCLLLM